MSTPLRVLIVEDAEDDALLLVRELRRGGYEPTYERVDTAPAMKAALEKQAWDLVIADYNMPEFSGPAALELLKREGFDLPFILVSGVIGEEAAVAVMKAGAQDFVRKDNLARLVPAIERELCEAEARRKQELREAEVRMERKKVEEALHESEALYRSLFENAPIGLGIADTDGNLIVYNNAMLKPGGYTRKDIAALGNAAHLFYDPGERAKILALAQKQGSLDRYETRFKRRDGTPYNVLLTLVPITIKGHQCWQTMVEDITDHKKAGGSR